MKKIVLNRCYGGFSLSDEAFKEYAKRKGVTLTYVPWRKYSSFGSFYGDIEQPGTNYSYFDEKRQQYSWSCRDIPRDDPDLVAVVEEMGRKADGSCAALEVVEIPVDEFSVEEYDGSEWAEPAGVPRW